MFKNIFLLIAIIFIYSGCDIREVKLLQIDPQTTKVGLVIDKKFIKIPKKVKKVIIVQTIDPTLIAPVIKIPKSVSKKKQYFKDTLVPIVKIVFNQLQTQYEDIKRDISTNQNREFIEKLKLQYKAKTDQDLLYALKPHPISIVLAQAAIESAWLSSRFTKEAYNIFGVWSFNKNEPRIAASGMRGDKTIYLKRYKTLKSAVEDYYKNLAKNWAYKEFRKQRTITEDPYKLVPYLQSYSEKKEQYTQLLAKMIKYNQFDKYDIKTMPIVKIKDTNNTKGDI